MPLSFEDHLRRRTVVDAAGLAVGEIVDVFFDGSSWRLESLGVKLRRDMADRIGAPRGLLRNTVIAIPAAAIQSIGDAVLLRIRADELPRTPQPPSSEAPPTGP